MFLVVRINNNGAQQAGVINFNSAYEGSTFLTNGFSVGSFPWLKIDLKFQ